MTKPAQFEELAKRCEVAVEPSFDLHCLIARMDFFREQEGDMGDDEIPSFGDSIDAATLLIPPKAGWNLQGNTNIFYAMVAGKPGTGCTAGLALSAAALRARATAESQP